MEGGFFGKGIRSERRGKFVGGVRPSLRSCSIHYRLYLISSAAFVFSGWVDALADVWKMYVDVCSGRSYSSLQIYYRINRRCVASRVLTDSRSKEGKMHRAAY